MVLLFAVKMPCLLDKDLKGSEAVKFFNGQNFWCE